MNAIADICVVPLGVGVSVSEYVTTCERIFREAGLNPQLHAYGTNVEGPWDDVMARCVRSSVCQTHRDSELEVSTRHCPCAVPHESLDHGLKHRYYEEPVSDSGQRDVWPDAGDVVDGNTFAFPFAGSLGSRFPTGNHRLGGLKQLTIVDQ